MSLPKIAFVSHLPLQPSGGGTYAVSYKIYRQLQRQFPDTAFHQVVPRVNRLQAAKSKFMRRVMHRPSIFHQFSDSTLQHTRDAVESVLGHSADAVFFRSSTRWIGCRPSKPYFVHTDAVFHTFFHNTFRSKDFLTSDLERIWREERDFLEGAAAVFFESEWGLTKAREAYGLQGNHYLPLRNGGVIEPPERDDWDGQSLRLVSIANCFHQKGGDIILDAFKRLKPLYSDLHWHIIGGRPQGAWKDIEGIHYEGFLRPDVPEEQLRFRDILSNAFLFVHPSREDVNPLVLIEAAYFGCPSITVNDFAIPELIINGKTGVLLDRPVTAVKLADAIVNVIQERSVNSKMRVDARERAIKLFSWNNIGDKMNQMLQTSLNNSQNSLMYQHPDFDT